ncbi:sigma-70 family RNA polymerase sigma factor [candidate division WOR-3 bacterium]|nr:sigma-70 family RNA polymerase sigma factor [candidate division WOR-3 bacterium]
MKKRRNKNYEQRKEIFDKVVKTNTPRIYKMIYNMTNNAEITRELTQEVFVNAWRGFKTFRGDSAVYTWLYRIALNSVFKYRREQAREGKIISIDDITHLATEGNPEKALIKKSDQQLIKRMLYLLPRKYQEVLVLRYYEDCDYLTISQILGIPIGTVRSRLHRTLNELGELVKEKI